MFAALWVISKYPFVSLALMFPPAPDIDTARAGQAHVIRSGRVIHCLIPHSSSRTFLLHTNRERAEITRQWPGQAITRSMECGEKSCNLPPCTFYNGRGGYLGYLTLPQARYFIAVIVCLKEKKKEGETGFSTKWKLMRALLTEHGFQGTADKGSGVCTLQQSLPVLARTGFSLPLILLDVLFQCSILDPASLIGTVRDKIFAYQLSDEEALSWPLIGQVHSTQASHWPTLCPLSSLTELVVAIWLPMTLHCCQLFAKLNCHSLIVKTLSANQRWSGQGSSQSEAGKHLDTWMLHDESANINRFLFNSRIVSLKTWDAKLDLIMILLIIQTKSYFTRFCVELNKFEEHGIL